MEEQVIIGTPGKVGATLPEASAAAALRPPRSTLCLPSHASRHSARLSRLTGKPF